MRLASARARCRAPRPFLTVRGRTLAECSRATVSKHFPRSVAAQPTLRCDMLGPERVDLAPTTGVAISVAQKAALQSSLPLLKKNYKFSEVFLFGKVLSKSGDYLISYGLEGSITSKKWFYWCVADIPRCMTPYAPRP